MLKAAIALAPYSPSQNPTTDRVPTMVIGGQNDTVVTPSHLDSLYASMPAATQSAFLQIAGADHVYYTQFLCPTLADPAGISIYHGKFPYVPPTTTLPGDAGALRAVDAGRCLDVTGAATADGSPVELWTCNGGSNQQWSPPS